MFGDELELVVFGGDQLETYVGFVLEDSNRLMVLDSHHYQCRRSNRHLTALISTVESRGFDYNFKDCLIQKILFNDHLCKTNLDH